MKSIALFGGSFSPAHMSHYLIVKTLLSYEFTKILVMPAKQNPLKQDKTPIKDSVRINMLEAMFSSIDNVIISTWELQQSTLSYSYSTIKHIKKQYTKYKIYLILGLDAFQLLPQWKNSQYVIENTDILLYKRKGYDLDSQPLPNKVRLLDTDVPEISSSLIRRSSLEDIENNNWLHPRALPIWKQYINQTYAT